MSAELETLRSKVKSKTLPKGCVKCGSPEEVGVQVRITELQRGSQKQATLKSRARMFCAPCAVAYIEAFEAIKP